MTPPDSIISARPATISRAQVRRHRWSEHVGVDVTAKDDGPTRQRIAQLKHSFEEVGCGRIDGRNVEADDLDGRRRPPPRARNGRRTHPGRAARRLPRAAGSRSARYIGPSTWRRQPDRPGRRSRRDSVAEPAPHTDAWSLPAVRRRRRPSIRRLRRYGRCVSLRPANVPRQHAQRRRLELARSGRNPERVLPGWCNQSKGRRYHPSRLLGCCCRPTSDPADAIEPPSPPIRPSPHGRSRRAHGPRPRPRPGRRGGAPPPLRG